MKEIWVKAEPWHKELVTTALEAGADAVIVPADKVDAVQELGLIKTVADGGDLKWGEDVVRVEVRSVEDEQRIVDLASAGKKVIVETTDWTIIPLENLVARVGNIMVEAASEEEAKTAAGVLEKGVDGVIISSTDPVVARQIIMMLKGGGGQLDLVTFRVEGIRPLGMGDRVCIDTCTMMGMGEGCLIGNSSQAMFLIHAESIVNPYVEPRPFRVNAGAVHAYVLAPGSRTRYLSELKAGDEVLGVNSRGETTSLLVGRVKIERRPLLLIEAQGPNGPVSTICQNAETIRLVDVQGGPLSVVRLQPGDEVLGYVESAGRHFGYKVSETITER